MSEMTLITRVFGKSRKPDSPIHIGAVKANLGHSESVSKRHICMGWQVMLTDPDRRLVFHRLSKRLSC